MATRQTLTWHLLAVLLYSCGGAIVFLIIPLIARLRFGAGDWQTFFITATPQTVMTVSILWGEVLARVTLRRYLLVLWLTAATAFLVASIANSYAWLLFAHLLMSIGIAGFSPLNSEMLKRFYHDDIRGRVYGLLIVPTMLSQIITVWGAGAWLQSDRDAFRLLLPLVAAVQGVGALIMARLCGQHRSREIGAVAPFHWSVFLGTFSRMNETLRKDRVFFRFEAAFMTYGAGYMICEALFPVLVTEKLGLQYRDVAESAHVVFRATLLAFAFPLGWLVDRIGAARALGGAFLTLAIYPVGLALARGAGDIAIISVLYGAAMAGVQHGWTLGPVTLAPTRDDVGHYAAIHATLVGLRGILMQGVGMLIYVMTGSFTWSLAVASVCFVWGAFQITKLDAVMRSRKPVIPEPKAQPAMPEPVLSLSGDEMLDR